LSIEQLHSKAGVIILGNKDNLSGVERRMAEILEAQVAETRRRYKPAETRQRILDAAQQLFATQGYVKTATSDIADLAGVAEGSIFYHFGSKQNLLAELGKLFAADMIAVMRGDSTNVADLEPGAMIERAFRMKMAPGGGFHNTYETETGLRQSDPELQPFAAAARSTCVAFVEQVMQANARPGDVVNIPVAASLAYAAVDACMHQILCGETEVEPEVVMRECIRFVRAALGYRPDGTR
jgi:AcrR family transcriptional regulator